MNPDTLLNGDTRLQDLTIIGESMTSGTVKGQANTVISASTNTNGVIIRVFVMGNSGAAGKVEGKIEVNSNTITIYREGNGAGGGPLILTDLFLKPGDVLKVREGFGNDFIPWGVSFDVL